MKLNLDYLLELLWECLALTCIYTKKRGREWPCAARERLPSPSRAPRQPARVPGRAVCAVSALLPSRGQQAGSGADAALWIPTSYSRDPLSPRQ